MDARHTTVARPREGGDPEHKAGREFLALDSRIRGNERSELVDSYPQLALAR